MCVLVCVQQTATDTNGIPRIPVAGRTAGSLSVCCLLTGKKEEVMRGTGLFLHGH